MATVSSERTLQSHNEWSKIVGSLCRAFSSLHKKKIGQCIPLQSIASPNSHDGFLFAFVNWTKIFVFGRICDLTSALKFEYLQHFKIDFPLHFHCLNLSLWSATFAPLQLVLPRNLISSLNSLTCFRIVDDNLKTLISEQTKNFQAFETHEEGNQ